MGWREAALSVFVLFSFLLFLFSFFSFCFNGFLFLFLRKHYKAKIMKKMVRKMSNGVKYALCSLFLGLNTAIMWADDGTGKLLLDNSNKALKTLVDSLITLMRTVIGLGAIIVLGMVIFKLFKGEKESAEKLAWWVAGLTIGFALLSVIKETVFK